MTVVTMANLTIIRVGRYWSTRLVLVRDCISGPLQNVGDNLEVVAGPHGIYVLGPLDPPGMDNPTKRIAERRLATWQQ